jgi:tetratricopeptide (TPR) repeat protein
VRATVIDGGRVDADSVLRAIGDLIIHLSERLRGSLESSEFVRLSLRGADIENVLSHAHRAGDTEQALTVFGSLGHYWWIVGAQATATYWASRLSDAIASEDAKPETIVKASMTAAISGQAFTMLSRERVRLEAAVQLAQEIPESVAGVETMACLAMAVATSEIGSPVAMQRAEQAESMADLLGDPFAWSFAQLAIAFVHASRFETDRARAMLRRTIGSATGAGIHSLASFAWAILGHVSMYAGEYADALESYEGAIAEADALEADTKLGTSARYAAIEARLMLGEYRDAAVGLEACLDRMRHIRDGRGAILASCRLAAIELDNGDRESAEQRLGFAQSQLRIHDEEPIRASVRLTGALLDATSGRPERARRAYERAMTHIEAGGIPLGPVDIELLERVEREMMAVTNGG